MLFSAAAFAQKPFTFNVQVKAHIYFLRIDVPTFYEKTTWDYYDLTREIECTNRQLKTDLNLRPIYHKKNDLSDTHPTKI